MRSLSAFLLLAVAPTALGAQAVVPVHQEPRHRLAYEDSGLRVLDIEIVPGDTTLFHRHDAPIAYVAISPTLTKAQVLGQNWGIASSDMGPIGNVILDEGYAAAPVEHRVTNLGNVPFRLIAVLNRGPGQAAGRGASLGTTDPIEASGRWFLSTHHTLASQATWGWDGQRRPVVIVQVTSGEVAVDRRAGSTLDLRDPGDFVVLQPGAQAEFHNPAGGPVTLAIIEVR